MSYYVNRYDVNLKLTGTDLILEVEGALDYATLNGYEEGLEEARYEYEDKLAEYNAPLNALIHAAEAAHLEHDRVWPMRQCSNPVCELASRQ